MRYMPSRSSDPQRRLNDIRYHIHLARRFTEGLSYDAFRDDDLRFYAVTRCLEIISEASRRLPADLKARHLEIPWTEMAAAGNVYRHEYEDVQQRLVWGTLQNRFPALFVAIEQELS
jgi:uncharacterized protein with HEPN domain